MEVAPARSAIDPRRVGLHRRRALLAAAMIGLQGYLAFDARAVSTWTNASGGTWSASSNWSDGVPTDTAWFGPANTSYTVDFSASTSVQTLNVQAGSDPALNLVNDTLTTGQVNVGGTINSVATTGTLGLDNGTLASSTMNIGGGSGSGALTELAGSVDSSTLNLENGSNVTQTGGSNTFTALAISGVTAGAALYNQEDGQVSVTALTINSGGDYQAGYVSNYQFTFYAGTVNVNTGGALHIADGGFGGGDANLISTLNVNGGTVGSVDLIITGAYNYTSGNTSALTLDLIGTATATVGNWTISGLYADSSVPLTVAAGQSITASGQESVGAGEGSTITMNQTGGANSAELLVLGDSTIGNGLYNLGNGTLDVTNTEYIGEFNLGTLNQSGGTNTVPAVDLGWGNGTVGYYTLSGGIVAATTLNDGMGYNFGQFTGGGSGTFIQSGGTAQLGGLNLSVNSLSSGTYSLSGSGLLSVSGSESIGVVGIGGSGLGTFIQTGGTNTDSGSLTIGPTGEYLLSGGSLSAGVIEVSGNMSISGGATVTGPLNISGAGKVTLGSGGGPQTFAGLSISGNGVLDLTNNHIFIDYGSSDPLSTIVSFIESGFNNGGWNGPGIISSTAAAENATSGLKYGIGFADGADKIDGHPIAAGLSSGQIELKYTLLGDANLDGTVNGSDFSILAANFGLGFTDWDQGNFLFTPTINGTDFSALAANFGQGDSGAASITAADIAALDSFAAANGLPMPTIDAVPEPGAISLIAMGAGMLLRRRSRGVTD
jgi:hypothetical protein